MEIIVIILVVLAFFGVISFQGLFGFLGAFVVVSIAIPLVGAVVIAVVMLVSSLARKVKG